jgi:hypothetical protein
MANATIAQTIAQGQIAPYLIGNDNSLGNLFGPRLAAPGSMVSIAMITDALNWGNSGGAQAAQDLRSMANYLIWLMGGFGQEAQRISQTQGGGAVVPGGSTYTYYNLVDTIGIEAVTYSNNILIRAQQVATMTVNSGSLQTIAGGDFTFNATTGEITWVNTFFVGDIIALSFLRLL